MAKDYKMDSIKQYKSNSVQEIQQCLHFTQARIITIGNTKLFDNKQIILHKDSSF